ncbi:MAG TPA: S8 family serine peptidase, partial [Chitinophagaceae bacterium]|nr:S8 family serine peptidase [Chitinophagaceae bacterium]
MKKLIVVLIGSCLLFTGLHAQFTRYIVKFKNKGGNPFSLSTPLTYLSQRALDRRTRYGIAIDSTDLPVTPAYVTQIRNVPFVTLLNISKWHNSVTIQTTDPNAITTINALSFVQSVAAIATRTRNSTTSKLIIADQPYVPSQRGADITADFFNYGPGSLAEINLHKGQLLHNIGLRGQGMAIAMLDGGFFNYTTLDAMDSIILNNQVLDTWDFYSNNTTVSDDHPHGMQCLSIIAANIPGQFVGKAPKANFLLYRTEDATTEYPIEEFNMVCGMERADSAGADLISASLGYSEFDDAAFNHTYAQMNGNTTIAAIGADLAAKKGILFVNAAGNEGGAAWHYIITPADGDSVLAIGAVNTSGAVGSFSSFGPSSDGQVKPDVASVGVGTIVQSTSNTVVTGSGTSFACPNMAGLASVLWQGFPEVNNMRIVRALREAGSIAATPNDRIGYGIPDLKAAFGKLLTEFATSSSTINECRVSVNWTSKDVGAMKYEVERKGPGEIIFSKVGELAPTAGVSLAAHNYQFVNSLPAGASGSFSYRIRQIIDTAAATFSAVYVDTTVATLASPCVVTGVVTPGTISNYVVVRPNPAIGSAATLIIETTDAIQSMPILVYNMNGRLVQRLQESKGAGKK